MFGVFPTRPAGIDANCIDGPMADDRNEVLTARRNQRWTDRLLRVKRPSHPADCLPPAVAQLLMIGTPDMNAKAVHGLASWKNISYSGTLGPLCSYRRHSSSHHVSMPVGHLTTHTHREVVQTIMPFQELSQVNGQKPATADGFERGAL